jgi:hypothetical protein
MKNIFLVPTDNYSQLAHSTSRYGGLFLSKYYSPMKEMGDSYQNIYITSDEEIKEGDWFWKPDCNMIFKAEYTPHKGCQKVILTTDQDLIKDGVQAIDDEFLEWFVKNPSCEFINIESWKIDKEWDKKHTQFNPIHPMKTKYKIIIPKEELKQIDNELRAKFTANIEGSKEFNEANKQETIEEAFKKTYLGQRLFFDSNEGKSFEEGVNCQKQRMYSEEEVEQIFNIGQRIKNYLDYKPYTFKEALEQFKKK